MANTEGGVVFEFYSRVILKLHERLKMPFALDADLFRNDTSSPHSALREALVNTLIHPDYEGRAGVRVLRDPSGYEFINPVCCLSPSSRCGAAA
jgi:ATP-dependent DNA helicase RecG